MQHFFPAVTLSCLLAGAVGCAPTLYPPSSGEFVKNAGGHGTAKVFGIDFEVEDPGSGAAGSKVSGGRMSDAEKVDIRGEYNLGDVKFVLEKAPGSPMMLTVNEKSYGSVEVGDSVSIDKKRVVKINGTVRNPSSEPEESDAGE